MEPISNKDAYTEAARIYTYFIDWRNKMLIRFGVLSGAILLLVKWVAETNFASTDIALNRNYVAALLFLISAGAAFVTWLMDLRNRKLTRNAANVCKKIEETAEIEGFYFGYETGRKNSITYHVLFSLMYLTATALYLCLAFYFLINTPLT